MPLALLLLVALAQAPSDYDRGRALFAQGDFAGAAVAYRRAATQFPTWGLARLELCEASLRLPDLPPALAADLQAAQKLEPTSPRVWKLTGDFHARSNAPQQAIEAYARAVALRPDYAEAQRKLGPLLVEADRHAEAVAPLEAALKAFPDDRALYTALAEAYEKVGEPKKAEATWRTLIERVPNSALFRRRLADFYDRTGQPQKAEAEREKADSGRGERKMRPLPKSKW